jgi:hypothetical protein
MSLILIFCGSEAMRIQQSLNFQISEVHNKSSCVRYGTGTVLVQQDQAYYLYFCFSGPKRAQ